MKHIKIDEIQNGFVVELFDDLGPSRLDKTVFCKSWGEVTKAVESWTESENNAIEEKVKP